MSKYFEELDYCPTPIGTVSLRRRRDLSLDIDVYEIKLDDQFVMSSLFTDSEVALARMGLEALPGDDLDVVVGGLGLGYTAEAVLAHKSVRSLIVVELLEAVVSWHETELLPLGAKLKVDARCRFVLGDFFALSSTSGGFDPDKPGRKFHAILLDIDHSPVELLDDRSIEFYQPQGLRRLMQHLHPGGVFALWSNDEPDDAFTERLASVFADARAEPVTFRNPRLEQDFTQTVYLARNAAS